MFLKQKRSKLDGYKFWVSPRFISLAKDETTTNNNNNDNDNNNLLYFNRLICSVGKLMSLIKDLYATPA